ncbi:MAG TPA: OmpH family outer membrane protein [Vicinamibacteria bacterium]|nr:OmpH family outer membrane protein [Vicinamibacteria bacterium]
MRKTLIAALALGAATAAIAQEGAAEKPKSDTRTPRIAVINLEKVWNESLMGKGYASRMEALANDIKATETKKQSEVQKMEAAVKALQEDLTKQQALLSPDVQERKRAEIEKKQRELQYFVDDSKAELEGMRQRAQKQAAEWQEEFQKRVEAPIQAVAKEKGIDIIIANQAAMLINKEFDISQEVVVKADDAERAAKAKAPAAAAPAKPAPAAPKPSPSPND